MSHKSASTAVTLQVTRSLSWQRMDANTATTKEKSVVPFFNIKQEKSAAPFVSENLKKLNRNVDVKL